MARRKSLLERRASQVSKHLNGRVAYTFNPDGSIDVYAPRWGVVVTLGKGAGQIWPMGYGYDCAKQHIIARVARQATGEPMHGDTSIVRDCLARSITTVGTKGKRLTYKALIQ